MNSAAPNEPVLLRRDEGQVAILTLNRPRAMNALSGDLIDALQAEFDRLAQDRQIRCVIVEAAGDRAFSTGHDLREENGHANMRKHETVGTWGGFGRPGAEAQYAREQEIYLGFCERWRNLPKPTVALVQGKVIAGGLMLIWPCDLIVAADDAAFLDHTVAMGVGGAEFFAHPWELGVRKAKERALAYMGLAAGTKMTDIKVDTVFSATEEGSPEWFVKLYDAIGLVWENTPSADLTTERTFDLMPGLEQIGRHALAHHPRADERDLHAGNQRRMAG